MMDRNKEIIKVSIKGIATNVVLVIFKAMVGFLANSTAIILDAVNNLSDALSSIITIIGTKLAGKNPDKDHPYGHGRVEYLTASVVAIIVIIAGLTSLKESIEKIIEPVVTNYTWITLTIVSAGIITKLVLGRYFKKKGLELDSSSLTASGTDALGDAIISLATLIAALITILFKINIDGWLGAIISLFILKAGIDIIRKTIKTIIGSRADKETTDKIKEIICSFPEVHGAYDLILHDYGPTEMYGSVHIEVDDNMTVHELDTLSRLITVKVYQELHIILTIGVYATNTFDTLSNEIKDTVKELIKNYPLIMQMHGFYVKRDSNVVSMDFIFDFKEKNVLHICNEIKEKLKQAYPDFTFYINVDRDFSD